MAVTVYHDKICNRAAANHPKTQGTVHHLAKVVTGRAQANLASARSTTQWKKISDPDHLTRVGMDRSAGKYGNVDYAVYLEAYKQGALAIEFGHAPSGVYAPKSGDIEDVTTRATHGLYILTRAAGLGERMVPSSGRKRGKR